MNPVLPFHGVLCCDEAPAFFHSVQVFCICSDSLFELGAPRRGEPVFAQSSEAGCPWSAFPRVLSFWGIQLVHFFSSRVALLMNSAACCCEMGALGCEHAVL